MLNKRLKCGEMRGKLVKRRKYLHCYGILLRGFKKLSYEAKYQSR